MTTSGGSLIWCRGGGIVGRLRSRPGARYPARCHFGAQNRGSAKQPELALGAVVDGADPQVLINEGLASELAVARSLQPKPRGN